MGETLYIRNKGVFVSRCLLGMKMSRLVNDHNKSIKPSSFIVNGKCTQIHDDGCLSIIISFGSSPNLNGARWASLRDKACWVIK